MKTLTLLRHAKTERDSPDGDLGRSLTERGWADAERMGREIRELGLEFDLVLASPARRVVETLAGLGEPRPIFDQRIYSASSRQLLDIVRSADDAADSILLVGHNPAIEEVAAELVANETNDFPTAALAEIELPIGSWRDVEDGKGRLVRFLTPKTLA